MFVYGIHGWIHLSLGRPGRWLRWAILEFVATGLMFVLALPWGPAGVAISWSISLSILTLPALWYAGKPIGLGVAPMIAVVWKFVVASLLAGYATALLLRGLYAFVVPSSLMDAIIRIAGTSLLFGTLYIGAAIALHRGFAPLQEVAGLMREMMSRRRTPETLPATADAIPVGSAR
jgi:PST family polysaccharide transporter